MGSLHLIVCQERIGEGEALAARLGVPLAPYEGALKEALRALPAEGAALVLEPSGLGLYALDVPGSGAVRVDLDEGSLGFRLSAERARHEAVVKACGLLKSPVPLVVFDATAGLLRDACVLAAAGADVWVGERSPVIAALVEDGLQRAVGDPALAPLLSHLHFQPGDSRERLEALAASVDRPAVVYLDPMFPHRDKSALVKKEMRVFRTVVGEDVDADLLLAPALRAATKRVVVKRPRHAPWLAGRKPSLAQEGKSSRFDIYLVPAPPA
ncbi:MAG TPA: class I SAM-dependent methyltransferase [Moraxellaceae bacterium]|nr:class I SAM-dependent methyltransferase [Moraxellaceae bacterium]